VGDGHVIQRNHRYGLTRALARSFERSALDIWLQLDEGVECGARNHVPCVVKAALKQPRVLRALALNHA
jgi:hypothetical protein